MPYFPFSEPRRDGLVGYHGTSQARAAEIGRVGFAPSDGDGEWLGHGVYFWDCPDAAWFWAEKYSPRSPAVLRATLVLGYCLDLDAPAVYGSFLQEILFELIAICQKERRGVPKNEGDLHKLDCAVLNLAAARTDPVADSVIRTCPAGPPLYPGTDILSETRRQICMRNTNLIHYSQPEYRRTR